MSKFPDPPFTLTAWSCGCNVIEGEVTHACRKGKKCVRLHPEPDYLASMFSLVGDLRDDALAARDTQRLPAVAPKSGVVPKDGSGASPASGGAEE